MDPSKPIFRIKGHTFSLRVRGNSFARDFKGTLQQHDEGTLIAGKFAPYIFVMAAAGLSLAAILTVWFSFGIGLIAYLIQVGSAGKMQLAEDLGFSSAFLVVFGLLSVLVPLVATVVVSVVRFFGEYREDIILTFINTALDAREVALDDTG
jgi:hypothetical protein